MRTRLTFAFLTLLCVALGAQQQPPPAFKSGVQLVEVDVRVFDKDGRFVTNLTREEFELLENGTPQKIEAMYLVGAPSPESPTPSPDPAVAPGAKAGTPLARRSAEREGGSPESPQTWIFFFDLNHLTPGGGFDRARKAVDDYIRDSFREGDIAGILAGDKMINNRLTSIRRELLEAVKQVKPRNDSRSRYIELTREWPRFIDEEEAIRVARNESEWIRRAVQRACSDDPGQCQMADLEVRQKAARLTGDIHQASMATLTAFNGLASGLARMPGPKTIVFLSDGFVIQDIETSLRTVVGQLARAGARVYAIDLRGIDRAGQRNIIDQGQVEDPAGPFVKMDSVADGPNSVAVDTGGLMIRNENNIGRALERVGKDAGRYYVLAYQPENSNFDGKYRPIQVRVRRDGLRVRARRGYLALPPARMLRPQPITAPERKPPAPSGESPEATPKTEAAAPAAARVEVTAGRTRAQEIKSSEDNNQISCPPDLLASFSKTSSPKRAGLRYLILARIFFAVASSGASAGAIETYFSRSAFASAVLPRVMYEMPR